MLSKYISSDVLVLLVCACAALAAPAVGVQVPAGESWSSYVLVVFYAYLEPRLSMHETAPQCTPGHTNRA